MSNELINPKMCPILSLCKCILNADRDMDVKDGLSGELCVQGDCEMWGYSMTCGLKDATHAQKPAQWDDIMERINAAFAGGGDNE